MIQALASIPSPPTNQFQIGPVRVTFYGIALALGIVAAFMLAGRRWQKRGGDPDTLYRIGLWSVAAGLAGARIAYVLPRLPNFLDRPLSIFAVWEGGLAIFGGLIGGIGVAYLMARRAGLPLADLFDAAAPALPLAQAIGRWGNYFNQELFGRPTDLPWGLEIDLARRPAEFVEQTTFHPTFLYESLWNLSVMAFLLWADKRKLVVRGSLLPLYLVLYAVGRFWIELLRVDTEFRFLGLSRNGWFTVLVIVVGLAWLAILRRRAARSDAAADEPGDEPERPAEARETEERA